MWNIGVFLVLAQIKYQNLQSAQKVSIFLGSEHVSASPYNFKGLIMGFQKHGFKVKIGLRLV